MKREKADRLNYMFVEQHRFNMNFVEFGKLSQKEKVDWTKEYILHIMSECDELLREMNWKVHRNEAPENIIISNLKEEIIDLMKYVLSISLVWDMDSYDLYEEFQRKSEVVQQRYKQEFELKAIKGNSIVGVDIDGILADYPFSFMEFVNKHLKRKITKEDLISYNLKECMGLTTEQYIEMKDLYRQSGEKRFIPLVDGAKEFLNFLNDFGYTVILLTARPYKKYKRIFADTQEWLKSNGLKYDSIIWDEEKDERLVREFGRNRISCFVEDSLSNANKISDLGITVYLLDKVYNQGNMNENVIRIKKLANIKEMVIGS